VAAPPREQRLVNDGGGRSAQFEVLTVVDGATGSIAAVTAICTTCGEERSLSFALENDGILVMCPMCRSRQVLVDPPDHVCGLE
jgi:hypothetical protein